MLQRSHISYSSLYADARTVSDPVQRECQALLALAGETCTPAISNRLDSFYVDPQIGALGTRRR